MIERARRGVVSAARDAFRRSTPVVRGGIDLSRRGLRGAQQLGNRGLRESGGIIRLASRQAGIVFTRAVEAGADRADVQSANIAISSLGRSREFNTNPVRAVNLATTYFETTTPQARDGFSDQLLIYTASYDGIPNQAPQAMQILRDHLENANTNRSEKSFSSVSKVMNTTPMNENHRNIWNVLGVLSQLPQHNTQLSEEVIKSIAGQPSPDWGCLNTLNDVLITYLRSRGPRIQAGTPEHALFLQARESINRSINPNPDTLGITVQEQQRIRTWNTRVKLNLLEAINRLI